MSQYQMQHRNATIRRLLQALVVAGLLLSMHLFKATLEAAASPQRETLDTSHLFLLPLGETPVELLTHTVDVAISVTADRALRMDVEARYRLHNPRPTDSTLLLQINTAQTDAQGALPPPQTISLQTGRRTLSLQPTGNGLQQTTQLDFGPDERQTLSLRYTVLLATSTLPAFVYPINTLDRWPGRVGSWRVTLNFADTGSSLLAPDNWLTTEPDGWTYNGSSLQWLSEDKFPAQPIRWQVIHPAIWQEIQTRQQAIRQQPTAADLRALGDLYRRLFDTAGKQTGASGTDRQRFYAQALGAYTDGLEIAGQPGSPPEETARLHRALAALYRSRSIQPDGSIDFAYIQLMVSEAEAALASLPPESAAERGETTGWLADGLRLQARQARQRKEWPAAIALLDRLAALPNTPADSAQLAEERNLLIMEQALQFLDQGNTDAALALVGSSLVRDDLLPAPEQQAIFARWQYTLTIRPGEMDLAGAAPAIPGREQDAQRMVDQLAGAWSAAQPRPGLAQTQFDGKKATIALAGLSPDDRLALIQATPQNSHWTLLRTLLVDSDAESSTTAHLIWQRTTLHLSLDLRPVADQWNGITAGLERESLAPDTPGDIEQRMRGQLRTILYRQEAERWQNLIRDSRVRIELAVAVDADPASSRIWSVQLTDSPQPMGLFAESISFLRLLVAMAMAMAVIFVLAGILWLLL